MSETLPLLERAVALGADLGDSAYEPYALSLSLLAWSYCRLGRLDDSAQVFARCVRMFEERGDMIGLAAALFNRCMLWVMTNAADRALGDYQRIIQISREHGFALAELMATKDLAEFHFMLGHADEAEPHVARAIDMAAQTLGPWTSRVFSAEVLLARIKWYRGEIDAARELASRIAERQAEAQASGKPEALVSPAERILLDLVDLAVRRAPEGEFDALLAKAVELTCQEQDLLEILEVKGLSALRAGRHADGRRWLAEAFAEAERRQAKLIADRIRRQIDLAGARVAS